MELERVSSNDALVEMGGDSSYEHHRGGGVNGKVKNAVAGVGS